MVAYVEIAKFDNTDWVSIITWIPGQTFTTRRAITLKSLYKFLWQFFMDNATVDTNVVLSEKLAYLNRPLTGIIHTAAIDAGKIKLS